MKLTIRPAVTLDGYIADINDQCYTWIVKEDENRYESELLRIGCELIGRKTYELRKEYYESRTKIYTFVYTNKVFKESDKVKAVKGTPKEILKVIEEKYNFKEIITCGGGQTLGIFASEGLVDEIYFSIHSVILGAGIQVFGDYKPNMKLKLLDVNTDIPEVVRLHYVVLKK